MSDQKKPDAPAPSNQKTLVVVVNNQERIELIGIPGNDTAFLGTEVTSDRNRGLLPGLNLVDGKALADCRKNPLFDAKFTSNIPRSVAREAQSENVGLPLLVQGKEVPAVAPFSKLSDGEARELATKICSEELAQVLLNSGEGRSEVRAVLQQRLEFLKTGSQPAESAS